MRVRGERSRMQIKQASEPEEVKAEKCRLYKTKWSWRLIRNLSAGASETILQSSTLTTGVLNSF